MCEKEKINHLSVGKMLSIMDQYAANLEASVRQQGEYGFPEDFAGRVTEYMASGQRARRLVDACLASPENADGGPGYGDALLYLLTVDRRPNTVKQRSTAYLYAFRKLMKMAPTERSLESLSALLEIFPIPVLLRVMVIDQESITLSFPQQRDATAYDQIRGSTYTYALSYLLDRSQDPQRDVNTDTINFIIYQLLFPKNPASIIANYSPLFRKEESDVYFDYIPNIGRYTPEITWLEEKILHVVAEYGIDVVHATLEIALFNIKHGSPQEYAAGKSVLIPTAQQLGLSNSMIAPMLSDIEHGEQRHRPIDDIISPILAVVPALESTTAERARVLDGELKRLSHQHARDESRFLSQTTDHLRQLIESIFFLNTSTA